MTAAGNTAPRCQTAMTTARTSPGVVQGLPSRPPDRQHHLAALIAFSAAEAAFQVEHARVQRQPPAYLQANTGDQLGVAANALHDQEITGAKILDPGVVEGSHGRRRVAVLFSDNARRRWASMVCRADCGKRVCPWNTAIS